MFFYCFTTGGVAGDNSHTVPEAKLTTPLAFPYTFDLKTILPVEGKKAFLCVGNLRYRLWSSETYQMLWDKELPVMPWFEAISKDGKHLLLSGMERSDSLSMYLNIDYESNDDKNIASKLSSLPLSLQEDFQRISSIISDFNFLKYSNSFYEYMDKRDDIYTVLLEIETNRVVWRKNIFAPVCFSADSKNVFIGNKMYDTVTGEHRKTFPLPGWVEKQVISPNGQYICFNIWKITPKFNVPNNEKHGALNQINEPCAIVYDIEKGQICATLRPQKSYCFRQLRFANNSKKINTLESEYYTQEEVELDEQSAPGGSLFPIDCRGMGRTWQVETGTLESCFIDIGSFMRDSILDNSLHIINTNEQLSIVPFELKSKQAQEDASSVNNIIDDKNERVAWLEAKWAHLDRFCQIDNSRGKELLGYTSYGQIVTYSLNEMNKDKNRRQLQSLGMVSQSQALSPDGRYYAYFNPIEQCVFVGNTQKPKNYKLQRFFISELTTPLMFSDDSQTLSFRGRIGNFEKRMYLESQVLSDKDNEESESIQTVLLDLKTRQSTVLNSQGETANGLSEKTKIAMGKQPSQIKNTFIILGKDTNSNNNKYTFKQDFKKHFLYLINKETEKVVWRLSDWPYQFITSYAIINPDESCLIINRYGIFKIAL